MDDPERQDPYRDWRLPPDSKDATYGDRLVRISRMGLEVLRATGEDVEIHLRAKLMEGGTPQQMKQARDEWDAFQRERAEREGNFRQMTQAERLQDARMNPAAKQVAAIDAAIEQKYGADSPEAARMKVAAREAIAQTLERGGEVRTPRVREAERRPDATPDRQRAATDKSSTDLER